MILKISRSTFSFALGITLCFSKLATPAVAAESSDTPWLIPPYVLEFTSPLTRLFGTNISFGARVSISQATDIKGARPATGLLLYRNGDTIFEPDSAPIKAPRANKKGHQGDFGLLITSLASKGVSYVTSEGVSGYTEVPLPKFATVPVSMVVEEMGKERAQGFDCIKKVVALAPADFEAQSYLVWTAPKLRDFPVKIERRRGGPALTFTFTDIRFEQPSDTLFAPPQSGYQRYESLHAMTDEMTRRVWNVMQRPDHSIAFPPSTARPPVSPNGGRPVY